jgi:signal transduction histidine kinase
MTPVDTIAASGMTILVVAADQRATALRQLVSLVLPRASVTPMDVTAVAEQTIPVCDVALVDLGTSRAMLDIVRVLRARNFRGAVVVLTDNAADSAPDQTAQSLGAMCITRGAVEDSPVELGAALTRSLAEGSPALAEVAQARRIFAAGQAVLSLQHSINNPLAALLAEAQLLEMEELTKEQHDSVERMIELCRRIVALVRRLDALAAS